MKRKVAIILTTSMLVALTACGSPAGDTVASKDSDSKVEEPAKGEITATETQESEIFESLDTEMQDQTEVAEIENNSEEKADSEQEEESDQTEMETADVEVKDLNQEAEQTEIDKKGDKKDTKKKDSNKKEPNKKTDKKDTKKKNSSKKDTNKKDTNKKEPNKTNNKTDENKTDKPSKKPEQNINDGVEVNRDTVSNILLADFKERAKADNTETIASALLANSVIAFMGATMPVEEGLLNGFGNAEITGFKEATMFAPMIGSIAFIGYVFELKEDTDAEQFMSSLKENADLCWNVCTEADEMKVSHVGNKVFFVMSPKHFEE